MLKAMRDAEKVHGIPAEHHCKILMTTGLNDMKSIMDAYNEMCDGYVVKPVTSEKIAKAFREIKMFAHGTAPVAVQES